MSAAGQFNSLLVVDYCSHLHAWRRIETRPAAPSGADLAHSQTKPEKITSMITCVSAMLANFRIEDVKNPKMHFQISLILVKNLV